MYCGYVCMEVHVRHNALIFMLYICFRPAECGARFSAGRVVNTNSVDTATCGYLTPSHGVGLRLGRGTPNGAAKTPW